MVALTETWFDPMESASRTLCMPVGYKLLDYPRTSRTGGGTRVLFRDNLTVKKELPLNCDHLSTLRGILSLKPTGSTLLSSTEYHTLTHIPSPQVSSSKSSQHFSNLQFFALLITGDFNIHMDVEADTA